MPWFRKHHTCPCGTDWWDEWDCLCNDRCPTCDAEIEPDDRRDVSCLLKKGDNAIARRHGALFELFDLEPN